jgi:transcriptional regulator with XRE-family HTH domain
MSKRRLVSSSLSARVIEYLVKQKHSQAEIAKLLGVSSGFVSLVKSRERSLTVDHLERLSLSLAVPLGALLMAVTKTPRVSKPNKRFFRSSEEIIKKLDVVRAAIMRDAASASR